MARSVDPDGDRTIGVVSKIDLMDEGTDALELLQGNLYPLKLGYFGVKCRSQKQIDDKVTIADAISREKEFFGRHPVYASYSDRLGIPYLSSSLNKILIHHIQRCIPSLNKQITEALQQKERELAIISTEDVCPE
jgi:dynamin 1-like protein